MANMSSPQPFEIPACLAAYSDCIDKLKTSKTVDFLPLVEADGLYFCVVPSQRLRVSAPARKRRADIRALGKAFRQAFNQVWEQIPEADRQCMLDHWDHSIFGLSLPLRPLIQIIDDRYPLPREARFKSLGTELNFSSGTIRKHEESLPAEIAWMLANVVHVASRDHWELTLKYLEEPMNAWESLPENSLILLLKEQSYEDLEPDIRHRIDIIDTAAEQKYKELVPEYQRHQHAAIADILRRWGFDDEARQNESVG